MAAEKNKNQNKRNTVKSTLVIDISLAARNRSSVTAQDEFVSG